MNGDEPNFITLSESFRCFDVRDREKVLQAGLGTRASVDIYQTVQSDVERGGKLWHCTLR